ncbi:hypothetical protein EKD04_017440 [Chloroflexales bacterium ZM16-3]|nr:hypothetical protein [Chloroflexales bacterium ZM16-3]
MPEFFLAIGSRPRRRDIVVSRMVGQNRFLVPLGSDGSRLLRREAGVVVVGDSGAWPSHNPARISLASYAREVSAWGTDMRFCLSYDTIGDPVTTAIDDDWLRQLVGGDAPVVSVAHVGEAAEDVADDVLDYLDDEERTDALAYGLSFAAGPVDFPALAVGGMANAMYSTASVQWLIRFVRDLERLSAHDPSIATLHLLGVGRAELALLSPLIESFDSSGPIRAAAFGWQNIAPNYSPQYGLSPAKLKRSREARLAFFLMQLRDRVCLPWTPTDEALLRDDEGRFTSSGRQIND